ncbi:MAG: hypothetical protein HWN51_05025 [Desulfobacterales bacterium]|nr:hypothetical protein [Desulfobacterales bacterium]
MKNKILPLLSILVVLLLVPDVVLCTDEFAVTDAPGSTAPAPLSNPGTQIFYDDGSAEAGLALLAPGADVSVRFTPPFSPAWVTRMIFCVYPYLGMGSFIIHVFDTDWTDLITPFEFSGVQYEWNEVDLSGYNIIVTGDFYLALEFTDESAPPTAPATFIGFDTNSSDSGRSYAGLYLVSIPLLPLWIGYTGNWLIRAEVCQIAELTVTKTGTPSIQAAPGTITWNITVQNTGIVPLTMVNVTDSRHGAVGQFGNLAPGGIGFITIVEHNLPSGTYTDQAFAAGYYAPETLTAIAWSDTVECIVGPTIESCDSTGVTKDTFDIADTVYVKGAGYSPSTTYDVYLVEDVTWVDGMAIPPPVAGTIASISSDATGNVPATLLWSDPLVPGRYDIVVDVDGDGLYYAESDALDDNDIEVTAGFFVIPEYPLGTVLGLVTCFAALAAYKSKRAIPH